MRISATFPFTCVMASLFVLTFGAPLTQSQTFSGTWHLNLDKSHWHGGPRPINVVLIIDHRGPEIQYHGAVTYSDADQREFAFAGAFDGKPYRMSRSYADGHTTLHHVNDLSFESTFLSDDGLCTETARTSISREGRTLTRKLTVHLPEGSESWTEVYERL